MKRWYVVQVYTGFEEFVKNDLKMRAQEENAEDLIGDILIPEGEMASFFSDTGTKKEKIFPGYLLVNLESAPEAFRIVLSTPRVTRFLGGESPVPLSDKEVDRIFSQMEGKLALASEKEVFSVGSEVHINSGPFSGFVGIVDKVDEDKERLTVLVSIFGRLTPVELGFDQIKK
ncbi:MAG: transcription termination/antitermination protein NusG [bacterium]